MAFDPQKHLDFLDGKTLTAPDTRKQSEKPEFSPDRHITKLRGQRFAMADEKGLTDTLNEAYDDKIKDRKSDRELDNTLDEIYGKGNWDENDKKIAVEQTHARRPMSGWERFTRKSEKYGQKDVDGISGTIKETMDSAAMGMFGNVRVPKKMMHEYGGEDGKQKAQELDSNELLERLSNIYPAVSEEKKKGDFGRVMEQFAADPDNPRLKKEAAAMLHEQARTGLETMAEYERDIQLRDQSMGAKILTGAVDQAEYMAPFIAGGLLSKTGVGAPVGIKLMLAAAPHVGLRTAEGTTEQTSQQYQFNLSGELTKDGKPMELPEALMRSTANAVREYAIERYTAKLGGKILGSRAGKFAKGLTGKAANKIPGAKAIDKVRKNPGFQSVQEAFNKAGKYTGVNNLFEEIFVEEYTDVLTDSVLNFAQEHDPDMPIKQRIDEATASFIKTFPEMAGSMLLVQGGQYGVAVPAQSSLKQHQNREILKETGMKEEEIENMGRRERSRRAKEEWGKELDRQLLELGVPREDFENLELEEKGKKAQEEWDKYTDDMLFYLYDREQQWREQGKADGSSQQIDKETAGQLTRKEKHDWIKSLSKKDKANEINRILKDTIDLNGARELVKENANARYAGILAEKAGVFVDREKAPQSDRVPDALRAIAQENPSFAYQLHKKFENDPEQATPEILEAAEEVAERRADEQSQPPRQLPESASPSDSPGTEGGVPTGPDGSSAGGSGAGGLQGAQVISSVEVPGPGNISVPTLDENTARRMKEEQARRADTEEAAARDNEERNRFRQEIENRGGSSVGGTQVRIEGNEESGFNVVTEQDGEFQTYDTADRLSDAQSAAMSAFEEIKAQQPARQESAETGQRETGTQEAQGQKSSREAAVRDGERQEIEQFKEPWEMTSEEFTASLGMDDNLTPPQPKRQGARMVKTEDGKVKTVSEHQKIVMDAISEGKPVPQEVIAEYPDLQTDQQVEREAEGQQSAEQKGQESQKGEQQSTEERNAELLENVPEELRSQVKIVDNADALPDEVKAQINERDVDLQSVEGIYYNGEVYIIAANAGTAENVAGTVIHEVAVHKGLRAALGDKGVKELSREIWRSLTEEQKRQVARRSGVSPNDAENVGEEWLAYEAERVAQENKTNNLWQRIAAKIRSALRNLGVRVEMSDIEIAKATRLGMSAVSGTETDTSTGGVQQQQNTGQTEDLSSLSKTALMRRARKLEIPGRSNMNKEELADAIRKRRERTDAQEKADDSKQDKQSKGQEQPSEEETVKTVDDLQELSYEDLADYETTDTDGVGKHKGVRYREARIAAKDKNGREHTYRVKADTTGKTTVRKGRPTEKQKDVEEKQVWESFPKPIRDEVDRIFPDHLNLYQKNVLASLYTGERKYNDGTVRAVIGNNTVRTAIEHNFGENYLKKVDTIDKLYDAFSKVGERLTSQQQQTGGDSELEAWQQTKEEYLEGKTGTDERAVATSAHAQHVKDAVEQGKPVPEKVLDAYKNNGWAQTAIKRIHETKVLTKRDKHSVDKLRQAVETIRETSLEETKRESQKRRKQVDSAMESLNTHARRLGIDHKIKKRGTFYNPQEDLRLAEEAATAVEQFVDNKIAESGEVQQKSTPDLTAKQISDLRHRLKYAEEIGADVSGIRQVVDEYAETGRFDADYRETLKAVNSIISQHQKSHKPGTDRNTQKAQETEADIQERRELIAEAVRKDLVDTPQELREMLGDDPYSVDIQKLREFVDPEKAALSDVEVPDTKDVVQTQRQQERSEEDAELDDLWNQLNDKFSQMNVGVDPEVAVIGSKIAAVYIKKGYRNFRDFALDAKDRLGSNWNKAKKQLRNFWNMAADLDELAEYDIDDVSRDEARHIVEMIDAGKLDFSNEVKYIDSNRQGDTQNDTSPEQGNDTGASGHPGMVGSSGVPGGGQSDVSGTVTEGTSTEEVSGQDSGTSDGTNVSSGTREGTASGRGARSGVQGDSDAGDRAGDRGTDTATDEQSQSAKAGTVQGQNAAVEFFSDNTELTPRGEATQVDANIRAIRTLKKLEKEDRSATPEEQKILSQYAGWGGIAAVLDDYKGKAMDQDYGRFKDHNWEKKWGKRWRQLKELLTEEEFRAAVQSTRNAHYTSGNVVSKMWDMASRLGFQGGQVGEFGAGIGHFLSLTPQPLRDSTEFVAVERDSVSSRILSKLHPLANVYKTSLENVEIPHNSLDMVMGNVPFAKDTVNDSNYPPFSVHNYFLARSIDAVRPGGLVIAITSNSTMDNNASLKARKWMHKKADLVSAVRLPNNAFQKNAHTEVVTDILVFRKRSASDFPQAQPWIETYDMQSGDNTGTATINQFYHANPQNLLGTVSMTGSMYGDDPQFTLLPPKGDLESMIAERIDQLPQNIISDDNTENVVTNSEEIEDIEHIPESSFTVGKDGKVYQKKNNKLVNPKFKKNAYEKRAKDFIKLRDETGKLISLQLSEHASEEEVEDQRKKLNKIYDAHVKEHGVFKGKQAHNFLRTDPYYPRVLSLEETEDKFVGEGKNRKKVTVVRKGEILSKRTQWPWREPDTAENYNQAALLSLVYRNTLNLDYMARLLGRDKKEVESELLKDDNYFKDPVSGQVKTREEYLSGNVVRKLEAAKDAVNLDTSLAHNNENYQRNIDALEKVQPERLPIDQVHFSLGSTWIPDGIVTDWLRQLFHDSHIKAQYLKDADKWTITNAPSGASPAAAAEFDVLTEDGNSVAMNAAKLAEKALNLTSPVLNRPAIDENGRATQVKSPELTTAAANSQKRLKANFQTWAKQDETASVTLEDAYNREKNHTIDRDWQGPSEEALRHYPGANSEVDGKPFVLRQHQRNAIKRILAEPTILAHAVGSGKTAIMVTAAMEARRLGTARKPLIVVQNSTAEQFADFIPKLYPNAKPLLATKKDFQKENRKEFFTRMATGDWDMIVMGQSQFDQIPDKKERVVSMIRQYQDEAEQALIDMAIAEEKRPPTPKQLSNERDKIAKKLGKLLNRKTDATIDFEDLGIDMLMIDEAHAYKKNFFSTKMTRVKGLDLNSSQKATSLYLKSNHVRNITGGKNIVLATGTPITNTLAEVWNMMRYVNPDLLAEWDIDTFDRFVSTYANIAKSVEIDAAGRFREIERLSEYINIPELSTLFRSMADVILSDDPLLSNVDKPELKGGKPTYVKMERTPLVEKTTKYLNDVYSWFENLSGKDRKEFSHVPLLIYNWGRKATTDMRLIDPSLPDEPGSKLNEAVRNIAETYKKTDDFNGTQVVFLDRFRHIKKEPTGEYEMKEDGTTVPKYREVEYFNAWKEIERKLHEEHNIPEDQIAVISDYNTEARRRDLYDRVNAGDVRVVIGSSDKLGIGVNIQERLVKLHDVDAPQTPAYMEQRHGRIQRQGNLNTEIEVVQYGVDQTLDAGIYQMLERKQKMINSALRGGDGARSLTDEDDQISFAEAAALFSGNPEAMEKVQVDSKLANLELELAEHQRTVSNARRKVRDWQESIPKKEKELEYLEKYLENEENPFKSDKLDVTVDGKKLEGTPKEIRTQLRDWIGARIDEINPEQGSADSYFSEKFDAKINGVSLKLSRYAKTFIDGSFDPESKAIMWEIADDSFPGNKLFGLKNSGRATTGAGMINSVKSAFDALPDAAEQLKQTLSELKSEVTQFQELSKKEFAKQSELEETRKRQGELSQSLQAQNTGTDAVTNQPFLSDYMDTQEDLLTARDEEAGETLELDTMSNDPADYSLSNPDDFFVINQYEGEPVPVRVKGESIQLDTDLDMDTFIYQAKDGRYVISDGLTGMRLAYSESRDVAIDDANRKLKDTTQETWQRILADGLSKGGATPRYAFKNQNQQGESETDTEGSNDIKYRRKARRERIRNQKETSKNEQARQKSEQAAEDGNHNQVRAADHTETESRRELGRIQQTISGSGQFPAEQKAEINNARYDAELARDPEFQSRAQRTRQAGVTLVPVRDVPFLGMNWNGAILVSRDNDGTFNHTVDHEIFHQLITNNDADAVALMNSVNTDTPAFRAYRRLMRNSLPSYTHLTDALLKEELAADYFAGVNPLAHTGRNIARAITNPERAKRISDSSRSIDSEYMDAVERGDMEAAQRLVDKAAKAAGYNVGPMWHGGSSFNVFEDRPATHGSTWGKGFYFTSSQKRAQHYGHPRKFYLKIENNKFQSSDPDSDGRIIDENEAIVYKPENIKSADPITRDSAGNVIPLSKRFNERQPDIRYRYTLESENNAIDEVMNWIGGTMQDITEPLIKRNRDPNEKPEVSKIRTALTTIQHYSERVPTVNRLFNIARDFDRRKHEILTEIFGPLDRSGDVAQIQGFLTGGLPFHQRFTGKVTKEGQALLDYIVQRDRDARGPKVKKTQQGFAVIDDKGHLVSNNAKTENEAWQKAHEWEAEQLQQEGFSQDAANALLRYRAITDRAYNELMRSVKEYEEKMEKLGLPLDKKTTDLFQQLREMGDRRGYYMPRRHGRGDWQLRAKRGNEYYFRKFDTQRARNAAKRKLAEEGWGEFEFTKTSEHPSEYALQDLSLLSLNDTIQNALNKMNTLNESDLTWDQFGLTAETVSYQRKDGDNENHLAIRGNTKRHNKAFEAMGGRWLGTRQYWFWVEPSEELKAEILKAVAQQEYGEALPAEVFGETLVKQISSLIKGHGSRSAKIERRDNVGEEVPQGYDEDPMKALANYGTAVAGGGAKRDMAQQMLSIIAGTDIDWAQYSEGKLPQNYDPDNAEHRRQKQKVWREYQKLVKSKRLDSSTQPNAYKAAVEYTKEMIRNEESSERIMGTLKGLAAIKFLTGIAPAGVNLTALVTNVPAVMKAYGNINLRRAPALISRGLERYGQYYMYHKFGQGKDLENKEAYGDKWLFDTITTRGYDEAPMVREALGSIQNQYGHVFSKLTAAGTYPFSITERFNRASTIAGAYWGIREKHKGKWTQQDAEAALERAHYISDQGHGVYSKPNLPDWARGTSIGAQVARSFYTYKTFSHNYMTVLSKLGYKDATAILSAINNKDAAELKRAIANNSSLYLMLSPMVLSGVGAGAGGLGLMLANSFMKALFSFIPDAEPPDDLEEWIWQQSVEMFGEPGGRLARQGVVGMTGINIKGSLAIRHDDFIPTSIPELLGAPYSLVEDSLRGVKKIAQGDTLTGAEMLAPRIFRGPLKAWNQASRGVTTRAGHPVYWGDEQIQPTMWDTAITFAGFNPANISEKRERQWREYKIKDKYSNMRSDIYKQIRVFESKNPMQQTKAEWARILDNIEKYNARVRRQGYEFVPTISDGTVKSVVTRASRPNPRERKRDN